MSLWRYRRQYGITHAQNAILNSPELCCSKIKYLRIKEKYVAQSETCRCQVWFLFCIFTIFSIYFATSRVFCLFSFPFAVYRVSSRQEITVSGEGSGWVLSEKLVLVLDIHLRWEGSGWRLAYTWQLNGRKRIGKQGGLAYLLPSLDSVIQVSSSLSIRTFPLEKTMKYLSNSCHFPLTINILPR